MTRIWNKYGINRYIIIIRMHTHSHFYTHTSEMLFHIFNVVQKSNLVMYDADLLFTVVD